MTKFEKMPSAASNPTASSKLAISSCSWDSKDLSLMAQWQGAAIYTPNETVEAVSFEIRDKASGLIIHERSDHLSARIGQLFAYSSANREQDNLWNCFNAVRLAIDCTTEMANELPVPISGFKVEAEEVVKLSIAASDSPFIYEWIDSRRTIKTTGPVHTGIVLGYDSIRNDALVFEKNGDASPSIQLWSDVVNEQTSITEQVNVVQFSEIFNDIDLPSPSASELHDMWWI